VTKHWLIKCQQNNHVWFLWMLIKSSWLAQKELFWLLSVFWSTTQIFLRFEIVPQMPCVRNLVCRRDLWEGVGINGRSCAIKAALSGFLAPSPLVVLSTYHDAGGRPSTEAGITLLNVPASRITSEIVFYSLSIIQSVVFSYSNRKWVRTSCLEFDTKITLGHEVIWTWKSCTNLTDQRDRIWILMKTWDRLPP
jgi:hypothetical protein